jgi:hypothetical protein
MGSIALGYMQYLTQLRRRPLTCPLDSAREDEWCFVGEHVLFHSMSYLTGHVGYLRDG